MQFFTDIVLLIGVLTIVASWFVAVRLINSDKAAGPVAAETAEQTTRRQDVLAGAGSR